MGCRDASLLLFHKLDISVFPFGLWLAITQKYTRVKMCNF